MTLTLVQLVHSACNASPARLMRNRPLPQLPQAMGVVVVIFVSFKKGMANQRCGMGTARRR